jgi:nucleotide-binding universal stress UspA family protein
LVEDGGAVAAAGVSRVVVGVSGSLGNLAAFHAAVERAQRYGAPLVAVSAWRPIGGEFIHKHAPCPPLVRMARDRAQERLRTALLDAFGGPPPGIALTLLIARGRAGPVLIALAARPGDLLVVGAGRRCRVRRVRHGRVSRYCLAHAPGPVLAVPPPELIKGARRGGFRVRDRDLAEAGLVGTATVKRR